MTPQPSDSAATPRAQGDALTVLRELPESFWDVNVWLDGEYSWGNVDVADRKRIVERLLEFGS